jgi:hypothetical protein
VHVTDDINEDTDQDDNMVENHSSQMSQPQG